MFRGIDLRAISSELLKNLHHMYPYIPILWLQLPCLQGANVFTLKVLHVFFLILATIFNSVA